MDRNFLSWITQKAIAERVALYVALFIGLIVAIAAWGKLLYPAEWLKTPDRLVGGFELIFLFALVGLRKYWMLWLASAAVFASWGGFAIYGYCLDLPCSCMGARLNIPTVLSISIDATFFVLSLAMAFLLGAKLKWLSGGLLVGFATALVGYACADCLYSAILLQVQ